jgi:hypothetical protein
MIDMIEYYERIAIAEDTDHDFYILDFSHDDLLEQYHYDPDTGIFIRRVDNTRADYSMPIGYRMISWNSKKEYAHRMAFFYMMETPVPKSLEIDHINRDRSDNRWKNLRAVTRSVNQKNRTDNFMKYHI